MTVKVAIYGQDDSRLASVDIEWADGEPGADEIVRVVEGVARVMESSVEDAERSGAKIDVSEFRAYTGIKAGQVCCLRAGSITDVVPVAEVLGNSSTQEYVAVAAEDIEEGEPMLWAAPPTGNKHVWRKRGAGE